MSDANTTLVNPPKSPEEGFHFTEDMTDETIAWIGNVRAGDPHRTQMPFVMGSFWRSSRRLFLPQRFAHQRKLR